MPGYMEILFFAFIALLLFGTRVPTIMRSMGQSISEFKKGARDAENEMNEEKSANRPV